MRAKLWAIKTWTNIVTREEFLDFLEHAYTTILTEITAVMQLIDGKEIDANIWSGPAYLSSWFRIDSIDMKSGWICLRPKRKKHSSLNTFWMKILKQNMKEFPYNYGYRSRIKIDATVD